MWRGKITSELKELYEKYYEMFEDLPDGYIDVYENNFTYEEFVAVIEKCLEKGVEVPELLGIE